MADPLRVLSLFSGVAGLDLGLRAAFGARVVCHLEREAYCAAVLLARMEDSSLEPAPVWCGDVREFDGREWRGRVDAVAAGWPCQPFSVAGKRGGESDERHLWPEVLRILGESEAGILFGENVPGHLSLGFAGVLGDLAALGFDAEWGLYAASEAGAPHKRERLFVLAHRNGTDQRRRIAGLVAREEGAESGEGDQLERDGDVADPDGSGLEREGLHLPEGRPDEALPDPRGAGATLGHADGGGRRPQGDEELATEQPHQAERELPEWPPGPGDAAAWSRVLAVRPDLAPALDVSASGRCATDRRSQEQERRTPDDAQHASKGRDRKSVV